MYNLYTKFVKIRKRIRNACIYTSKKISLKFLFLSDIFLFPFIRQQFPVLTWRCSWWQCCSFVDDIGYIVKEYAVCWLIAKMPMLIGENWSRDSKKKVMKPWQIVTGWNFMPLTANCAWQTLPTQSNSSALSSRFLHQRQSLSRYDNLENVVDKKIRMVWFYLKQK